MSEANSGERWFRSSLSGQIVSTSQYHKCDFRGDCVLTWTEVLNANGDPLPANSGERWCKSKSSGAIRQYHPGMLVDPKEDWFECQANGDPLPAKCDECHGRGWINRLEARFACNKCDGSGKPAAVPVEQVEVVARPIDFQSALEWAKIEFAGSSIWNRLVGTPWENDAPVKAARLMCEANAKLSAELATVKRERDEWERRYHELGSRMNVRSPLDLDFAKAIAECDAAVAEVKAKDGVIEMLRQGQVTMAAEVATLREECERLIRQLAFVHEHRLKTNKVADGRMKSCGQDGFQIQLQHDADLLNMLCRESAGSELAEKLVSFEAELAKLRAELIAETHDAENYFDLSERLKNELAQVRAAAEKLVKEIYRNSVETPITNTSILFYARGVSEILVTAQPAASEPAEGK